MGIYRPEQDETRGDAGETSSNQRNYNFANLYALNRGAAQAPVAAESQKMGNEADMANSEFSAGKKNNNQNQMASAVAKAQDISNRAQNFSVQGEALKNGASGYQSGIEGFYAGSNNPNVAKINSYSNIYQNMMGSMPPTTHASNTPSNVISKPNITQAVADKQNVDRINAGHNGVKGNKVDMMNNLDWLLKTGRIDAEEYYKAQSDPEYYAQIAGNI